MLRVTLVGNLGADPELRYTQKGTEMVSFNVAVNQVRTGPGGERQESTEWFRVKATNRLAEFVQRLTKGTRVLVMGRLDIGHFQGRDGEPRTSFDVWADEVQSMGARMLGAELGVLQESEPDGPEPAVAGVSSLGSAPVARAGTNGKGASRSNPRTDAARSEGEGQNLEDLPF